MTPQPNVTELHTAVDTYATSWQSYMDELTRAWGAERQGLLDRIALLEEGDTTPPPAVTLFGSSQPIVAGVPAVRVYVAAGKTPIGVSQLPAAQREALTRMSPSGALVLSWKEAPGSWLATFLHALRATYPHATIYGCQNHEPYDNFSGASGLKVYHSRWDAAVPIMEDHGVIPTTILDGSHPESWESFTRADAQVYGMDKYNPGIQTPKAYVTPALVFGAYLEYLEAHGMPGLLAETGTGRTPDDLTGQGQLDWAKDSHHYLEATGLIVAACWWSQGGCTLTPTLWDAWLHG